MAQKFNYPFGSGGKQPQATPKQESELNTEEAGAGDHAAIHQHLMEQHQMDGKAHSHVVHNGDGTHTSHHVKDGQVSGPHDHENLEALKDHFDQFLDEEGQEGHEPSEGEDHDGY